MKKGFKAFFGIGIIITSILTMMSVPVMVSAQSEADPVVCEPGTDCHYDKCEILEAKIDQRIKTYDANREAHIENYYRVKFRVQILVNRMKSRGYDTSKLEQDLQILDEKVKAFGWSYNRYINSLRKSQNYECGASWGRFVETIREARMHLQTAKLRAIDINLFIRNVIIPDLRDLIPTVPPPVSDSLVEESES